MRRGSRLRTKSYLLPAVRYDCISAALGLDNAGKQKQTNRKDLPPTEYS